MEWITTTQVLEEMKGDNGTHVWVRFRDTFYPVICNFAKSLGLNETDAEDAAQETMLAFIKAYRQGGYRREKGPFGHWLFGVARRVIMNYRKHLPREHLIGDKTEGTCFWDKIADENAVRHTWETEWRQMVLERCLQQARREIDSKVYSAFELYALEQKPIEEVCRALSMSPNAVYIAKSRVLSKLRQLQQDFEETGEEAVL